MIPKTTQDAPNIAARYHCSRCGRRLWQDGDIFRADSDNYCSGCGEQIEWDKLQPIEWHPMSCDICGAAMIVEIGDHMATRGNYVGTTTCRDCMEDYCSSTNCLGCKRGIYPGCKYLYLKHTHKEG